MCGRVRLSSGVSEIKLVFSIPPHRPTPNFAPSWNTAPTDSLPVVRYDTRAGERSLDLLRWGLVPHWAKDINVGFANINAKAEGIESKPAFRDAFQRRRCLVPVDNFYEWKKVAAGKQPHAIALADQELIALAGLWENWRSPAGEWVRSFAIITTTPNELCAELHNRMPVVLGPETWPAWLGEEPADARQLKALLAPFPSEAMTCWLVSARVGNVKNNDPSLIEPIAAWSRSSYRETGVGGVAVINPNAGQGEELSNRHTGADSCRSEVCERRAGVTRNRPRARSTGQPTRSPAGPRSGKRRLLRPRR